MAIDMVFSIMMIVLAVLLIGSVALFRSRRKSVEASHSGRTSYEFKDCYDLCLNDPRRDASRSCNTECLSYGGA